MKFPQNAIYLVIFKLSEVEFPSNVSRHQNCINLGILSFYFYFFGARGGGGIKAEESAST